MTCMTSAKGHVYACTVDSSELLLIGSRKHSSQSLPCSGDAVNKFVMILILQVVHGFLLLETLCSVVSSSSSNHRNLRSFILLIIVKILIFSVFKNIASLKMVQFNEFNFYSLEKILNITINWNYNNKL